MHIHYVIQKIENSMRCQFCGWENPDSKTTCEKCNQPLQTTVNPAKSTIRENNAPGGESSRSTQNAESFNPKATVREQGSASANIPASCPSCGYKLDGETVCPVCGKDCNDPASTEKSVPGMFKKTVRPNHNHRFNKEETPSQGVSFRLIKILDSGEASDCRSFASGKVDLNRDNTDPSNKTITSHTQATIQKDGEKWLIVDRSELKSTFVQASRPIELQNGDIILLGDQLFRFEAE